MEQRDARTGGFVAQGTCEMCCEYGRLAEFEGEYICSPCQDSIDDELDVTGIVRMLDALERAGF